MIRSLSPLRSSLGNASELFWMFIKGTWRIQRRVWSATPTGLLLSTRPCPLLSPGTYCFPAPFIAPEALSSDLCSSLDVGPSYRMQCWKQDLISVGLSNPFLFQEATIWLRHFLNGGKEIAAAFPVSSFSSLCWVCSAFGVGRGGRGERWYNSIKPLLFIAILHAVVS